MEPNHWSDDDQHPLYVAYAKAMARPWLFLDQGWPQVNCPGWDGRGLMAELGVRAWGARRTERLGWWPPVLDAFEQQLTEREQ